MCRIYLNQNLRCVVNLGRIKEVVLLNRLKQALDSRGITQKSCAELLGITEKTLYNKMTGSTEFTYSEVKRLQAFLPEYNIDYLLSDERADDWGA